MKIKLSEVVWNELEKEIKTKRPKTRKERENAFIGFTEKMNEINGVKPEVS